MPILARAGAAAAKGFGMLGKIAAAVDEYFEYVTLLLHGNGTNGAQNNTFLDSSTNNFTITRNGNTTQGTFTPYGSLWSNYFDGSGDYLSDIGTTSSFNFLHNTTALFTFECWVYLPSTAAAQSLIDNTNGTSNQIGIHISLTAGGNVELFITRGVAGVGNVTAYVTSTGTVPTNQWAHIAVTYDQSLSSNNAKFYINGVAAGSGNKTGNTPSSSNASNAMRIGCYGAGAGGFVTGYISNLRITNSVVYTSAFTPSTSPLTAITNTQLLTCQSNRFIDNSSNAFTITRNGDVSVQRFSPFNPTTPYAAGTIGGSGYFDGSGDYLDNTSGNAAFAFGTGDFTVEMWVYIISSSSFGCLYSTEVGSQTNVSNTFQISIDGSLVPKTGTRNAYVITASSGISANSWNHLAVTRSGSTWRMFVNGVLAGSATDSTSFVAGGFASGVLPRSTSNTWINGHISNLRVVNGTAVYTAAFTPPTAPLTAITNTSLLLNMTNGGIIDNAMMNNLETVGNAQISTSVSKFGGGSMAFDGTGDYCFSPANPLYAFNTGDFTVEMWVYFNALASNQTVAGTASTYLSGGWQLIQLASTTLSFLIESNPQKSVTTGTLSTGQWYHIAVTRSGTTLRIFVNGVLAASATSSENITDNAGNKFVVGNIVELNAGRYLNGYIDDLRITKGYARYTANFTPPAAPFPDQ